VGLHGEGLLTAAGGACAGSALAAAAAFPACVGLTSGDSVGAGGVFAEAEAASGDGGLLMMKSNDARRSRGVLGGVDDSGRGSRSLAKSGGGSGGDAGGMQRSAASSAVSGCGQPADKTGPAGKLCCRCRCRCKAWRLWWLWWLWWLWRV